jgi:hypothetical protein
MPNPKVVSQFMGQNLESAEKKECVRILLLQTIFQDAISLTPKRNGCEM